MDGRSTRPPATKSLVDVALRPTNFSGFPLWHQPLSIATADRIKVSPRETVIDDALDVVFAGAIRIVGTEQHLRHAHMRLSLKSRFRSPCFVSIIYLSNAHYINRKPGGVAECPAYSMLRRKPP